MAAALLLWGAALGAWNGQSKPVVIDGKADALPERIETLILRYTNVERQKAGLVPLKPDAILTQSARGHSSEMAKLNYFGHRSPNAQNRELEQRLRKVGATLEGTRFGENIGVDFVLAISDVPYIKRRVKGRTRYYTGDGFKEIQPQSDDQFARSMVAQWMASPGHRANILNPGFTHIGIGVARGRWQELDAFYVTQNFQGALATDP